MDFKALIPVLEAARPGLQAAAAGTEVPIPGHVRSFSWELERGVAAYFEADPPLPTTRPFGGIHLTLSGMQLARALLTLTTDEGAEPAVSWLERVVAMKAADVRVVAEIRGLTVNGVVELPCGVYCAPIHLAPQSPRIQSLRPRFHPSDILRLALEPTTSVMWIDLPGLRYDNPKAGDAVQRKAMERLWRAVLGLTLLLGQAPLMTRVWTEFHDAQLSLAVNGVGWTPQIDDGAPLPDSPPPINQSDVAIAAAYLALPTKLSDQLALAISRVSLARRRMQTANQAIEICTALESLFGDKDNKQELTYRLRLRAALFHGQTLEQRRKIRKDLADLYSIRSKAVHGGASEIIGPRHRELIGLGIDLAVRTIRRIIDDRAWPNWPDLELAPPPLSSMAPDA